MSPADPAWLVWGPPGLVGCALAATVLALGMPRGGSATDRRLRSIDRYVEGTGRAERKGVDRPSRLSTTLSDLGERAAAGRSSTARTSALLERADLPLRTGEWVVLRAVAVLVGAALGLLMIHGSIGANLIGLILGACLGTLAPVLFLRVAAGRRARKFESQLPDVLTLVASSLQTGFSLLQALDAVAQDVAEPSAKELSRALAETRIGADIGESLDRMADRMDSNNLRWTSMAISIQRQVGGNLAETLRTTAATLRDRESLHRHVRALSAEGRLSAYVLIAMPVGIFLYMTQVNRPYVSLLWTTPLGLVLSVVGLVQLAIGMVWMRHVVNVEV
ncbi:MAG: type II secretion system F family protein [Oryzihumus sp.]